MFYVELYVSAHRFVKMHFPKGDTDTYLLLLYYMYTYTIYLFTDAFSAFLTTTFVKMISSRKSSAKLHKFSRLSCNENEAGGLTVTLMSSCPFYITEA